MNWFKQLIYYRKSNSGKYHTLNKTSENRIRETIGKSLPKIESGEILDWGCSTGLTTLELSSLYPNSTILGIDIRPNIFGKFKSQNVKFQLKDGYNLTSDFYNRFSGIFMMNNIFIAIETNRLYEKDIIEIFQKVGRCVKENGYIVLSEEKHCIIYKKENELFKIYSCSGDYSTSYGIYQLILQGLNN